MTTEDSELDNVLAQLGVPPLPAAPLYRPRPSRRAAITINGVTKSRREWALENGLTEDALRKRIARGETADKILRAARPFGAQRDLRRAWVMYAKDRPCEDCGVQYHAEAMEFDHVRGEKLFEISRARGYTTDAILAEIAKCDLVCANCHRARTASRRSSG